MSEIPHKCPALSAAQEAVTEAVILSIRAQLAAEIAAVRAQESRLRDWLRWAQLRKLAASVGGVR